MIFKYALAGMALTLTTCVDVPEAGGKPPQIVGKTQAGKAVYRYQLTRSSAFSIVRIPNSAIAARSAQLCPGGYKELERSGQVERRISGTIYTDVFVTVACT